MVIFAQIDWVELSHGRQSEDRHNVCQRELITGEILNFAEPVVQECQDPVESSHISFESLLLCLAFYS